MEPFNAEVRLMLARERAARLQDTTLSTRKRARPILPTKQPSIPRPERQIVLGPSR